MSTLSPYQLLRGAAQLFTPQPRFAAERWTGAHAPASPSVAATAPSAPVPAPVAPDSPASRMRTPPPMYPPTGYPTAPGSYTAPQPTRRQFYDAVLTKHQEVAASKVQYQQKPLEPPTP